MHYPGDVRALFVVALVVALGATGCYRRHGELPPDAAGGRRDGGVARDAGGVGSTRPDAGPGRDAGEAPLPRDFEDPGPDARPSDDGGGAGWRDDPDLDPDGPCCDPLGPPVDIVVGDEAYGDVDLDFADEGWGVLYADIDHGAAFQALTLDGVLDGPTRSYPEVQAVGARLAWGEDRFGALVVREGSGDQDTALALLDRRGVRAAGWTDLVPHLPMPTPRGARPARVAYLDRWLVVSFTSPPGEGVVALEIDGAAQVVGRADVAPRATERAQVVGMKSRGVVFWRTGDDTFARTLTVPLAELATEPIRLGDQWPGDLVAARFRDRSAVLSLAPLHDGGGWWFALFDPFTDEAEVHWVPNDGHPIGLASRMTALDDAGLLAFCATLPTPEGGLTVQLITPEGAPVGAPLEVMDDAGHTCALGAQGDRLYVAWARPRLGTVRVQGYALRRRTP